MELFGPAMLADPYAAYAELRERDPVYWSERLGAWVLTRDADVRAVLRDPTFSSTIAVGPQSSAQGATDGAADVLAATYSFVNSSLVFSDPPEHTRLRRLLSRAFVPSAIERLADEIRVVTERLLDAAGPRPDLVHDQAEPLPVAVLGELLGVRLGEEEGRRLKSWCNDFLLPFGRDVRTLSAEELVAVRAAAQGLSGFVTTVLERHRPADEDDVIGRLLAGEADDRLSRQELFANIVLLLIAGHENSSSLIANGAVWLIDLPDVRELLTGDAGRWPDTVDELLRLVTPNQFIRREARGTTVIGERTVRAGDAVLLVLAAANRDPARFADPDVFVLDRPGRQDVALGHGFHYCRPAQPLAAWHEREHQRATASVLPEGHRPVPVDDRGDRGRRRDPQRQATQDIGLEDPSRSSQRTATLSATSRCCDHRLSPGNTPRGRSPRNLSTPGSPVRSERLATRSTTR